MDYKLMSDEEIVEAIRKIANCGMYYLNSEQMEDLMAFSCELYTRDNNCTDWALETWGSS